MYTPRMLHRTRVLRRPAVGALHRSVHGEGGRAAAFEARSVLLLPKTPRWRHELASRGLSEVVARELLARGEAWPRAAQMCQANDAHAASVAHLERCFGEAGIAVRTLAAAEATAAQVAAHAPALVCTAGGDGTLLRTATLLPPSTPLLAINTDPAPSYVQNGLSPAARGTAQPRGTVRPAGAQQAALSARAASGCPELWSASENQPLGPSSCRAVISALLWTQERSTGALCSAQISPHASAASAAHVAASLRGGHFSVRRRARVQVRARVVLRARVWAAAPAPCAAATRQASDTPTACPPSMA